MASGAGPSTSSMVDSTKEAMVLVIDGLITSVNVGLVRLSQLFSSYFCFTLKLMFIWRNLISSHLEVNLVSPLSIKIKNNAAVCRVSIMITLRT